MANTDCISRVFAALRKAYPDYVQRTLSAPGTMQEQMGMYARFFADVPDSLLEMAVVNHVGKSQWWPKVSELREGCGHLAELANDVPNEFDAWAEVNLHMRAGHSKEPWSHPLIGTALDGIGGLAAYGQSDVSQEAAWRARFYGSYRAMQTRERERRLMLPEVRAVVDQIAAGQITPLLEDGE